MTKKLIKEFEQHYFVMDNGDGSARCVLVPNYNFGRRMEDAELSNGNAVFCDAVSSFTVRVWDDGTVDFPEMWTEDNFEEAYCD